VLRTIGLPDMKVLRLEEQNRGPDEVAFSLATARDWIVEQVDLIDARVVSPLR